MGVDGAVSAVLLAAGESRRMGAANKLALPVGGVPLLRRSAQTLLAARLGEVVVVLGHDRVRVGRLLDGLPVRRVVNPHYRQGQMGSVSTGLAALARPAQGVMVCLADQPLLEVADVDRLVDAFLGCTRGSVLVPTYRGQRGNPVVIAHSHREAILGEWRGAGARGFIDGHPELIEMVEWPNDHVVFDLDTPEDYETLRARLDDGVSAAPG